MKSIRLDPELEQRLQQAATVTGESLSGFIRRAAGERADTVLTTDGNDDFADVIGAIHGGGGRARHTGKVFTEQVTKDSRRRDDH